MEFKGTKGKWYIGPDLFGFGRNLIMTNKGVTFICDVYKREGSGFEEDHKYNAQLIAHAPEMLEHLNKISNFIELNKDKNYMIELLNREVPGLSELIKSATEIK